MTNAQRRIEHVELLGRDDGPGLGGDSRCLHALARVQERHLVLQRGREDRAQDDLVVLDRDRLDPSGLQLAHPLTDVLGKNFHHPHRPEFRHDVLVDGVGVALPGRLLHLMVRQPRLLDVALEGHPAGSNPATPTRSSDRSEGVSSIVSEPPF